MVPPSDVHRGDLECHASFTDKLVLELVEVWVRGSKGIGLSPSTAGRLGKPPVPWTRAVA
jgi:hypothetical protein